MAVGEQKTVGHADRTAVDVAMAEHHLLPNKEGTMQKIALWLALAALGVNAPRFVILFLNVDGIYLPRGLEGLLLAITGIVTGPTSFVNS
jgi:hypothetical protein